MQTVLSELIVRDPRFTQVPGALIYTRADTEIATHGIDTSRLRIGADTQLTPFQAFELEPEDYGEWFLAPGSRLAVGAALRRYADGTGSKRDAQRFMRGLADELDDPSMPTRQPELADDLRYGAANVEGIAAIVKQMDTALRAKAVRIHEFLEHNGADELAAIRILGYLRPLALDQSKRGLQRLERDIGPYDVGIEAD